MGHIDIDELALRIGKQLPAVLNIDDPDDRALYSLALFAGIAERLDGIYNRLGDIDDTLRVHVGDVASVVARIASAPAS